jgi:two-component system sensor histidine kinase KdpD
MAVHVVNADAPHEQGVDTSFAQELVREFEGEYHEIVDENVASGLVSFARSERGTQVVLGASRPRSLRRPRGGVVENVLRRTPDLDVHVIAVGGESPEGKVVRREPVGTSKRRTLYALVAMVVTMPLVTFLLTSVRSSVSNSTEFLSYLVVVLFLGAWGGTLVGVVSALVAFALEKYYFVAPLRTVGVARPDDVVALVAFLVFAVSASVVVKRFSRRSHEANRARAEAQILATVIANIGTTRGDLARLLDSVRVVFNATSVSLVERREGTWHPDIVSGAAALEPTTSDRFRVDADHALLLDGAELDARDRTLVQAVASLVGVGAVAASHVVESGVNVDEQRTATQQAQVLLAVATSLQERLDALAASLDFYFDGSTNAPLRVQRSRASAIESQVKELLNFANNLRDVGRLEMNDVAPNMTAVVLDEVVRTVLASFEQQGRVFDVDLTPALPALTTDREMLERALTVVVQNAHRFSDIDRPIRVTGGVAGSAIELLVIDRGRRGAPAHRQGFADAFTKRMREQKDVDLGLDVARGFIGLLGGALRYEDTPGGGLTVVLTFSVNR